MRPLLLGERDLIAGFVEDDGSTAACSGIHRHYEMV